MSKLATVAVACQAMATRFEIVLYGESEVALRAAAEEALDEIQRLERQLSLYDATSEISFINARAAAGPVKVEPGLFRLLQDSRRFSQVTGGAFDITVAPLMRCWGFMRGSGRQPDPAEVNEARMRVGMNLIELDEDELTVRFTRDGVMLDLGSIGKGFALECAVKLLIEAGVTSAILHGGTSTVHALGSPPEGEAWNVAIPHPESSPQSRVLDRINGNESESGNRLLAVVPLKNESLSVSAVWGKAFEAGGRIFGHVMDPRKGEPVERALLAAVVSPSATETDALSTALLTLGDAGLELITGLRAGIRALVACPDSQDERIRVETRGIGLLDN